MKVVVPEGGKRKVDNGRKRDGSLNGTVARPVALTNSYSPPARSTDRVVPKHCTTKSMPSSLASERRRPSLHYVIASASTTSTTSISKMLI
jgi:hypothetical protein